MTKRGAFIIIEGLDKSGKSTQAKTLLRRLQDAQISAKLINFPGQCTVHNAFMELHTHMILSPPPEKLFVL